jgi:pimeloyl-ACP methyl ester carboxylesterase
MIHGNYQNGTNFLGTPDDRDGWAVWFLRHGYAVYVVDQVARGRSHYDPAVEGPARMPPTDGLERQFTAPERFKLWPQAALHTQWPGTGMAGDPVFDQFQASQQVSMTDNPRMDALNRIAGADLLRRIGPSILLTHSRSGAIGWVIADDAAGLVKGIVAVEPSGPPFFDVIPVQMGEPKMGRLWGLSYDHLTFDPPVTDPSQLAPLRDASVAGPDMVACWEPREKRQLPHLMHFPIMVLTSEASYHAGYDQCTVTFLRDGGADVDWVKLADLGIHGNGHMMMLEKNSDDVARVITTWLGAHIK